MSWWRESFVSLPLSNRLMDGVPNKKFVIMFRFSSDTDKGNLNVNMYESVLRLQGAQQALSDTSDCKFQVLLRWSSGDSSFSVVFFSFVEKSDNRPINEKCWVIDVVEKVFEKSFALESYRPIIRCPSYIVFIFLIWFRMITSQPHAAFAWSAMCTNFLFLFSRYRIVSRLLFRAAM